MGSSTDEIATICIVEKAKLLQKGSLNEVNCCKMGLHARAKRKEKKVNKRDYYSLCAHARMEKEQNNLFFLNLYF